MPTESSPGSAPFWTTPEFPRVLPFAVFLLIGSLAGKFFPGSEYWIYALKTLAALGAAQAPAGDAVGVYCAGCCCWSLGGVGLDRDGRIHSVAFGDL